MHVYIFFMQLTCLTCDSGTETAGEHKDYYDPLFTYREGDEASYFVISEDSEGGAADVGPSSVGAEKESLTASGSGEQFAEPVTCNPLLPDVRIIISVRDTTYNVDLTFLVVKLI